MERDALTFTQCMRFPRGARAGRITASAAGQPIFDLHGTSVDPKSPRIRCQRGAMQVAVATALLAAHLRRRRVTTDMSQPHPRLGRVADADARTPPRLNAAGHLPFRRP